MVVTFSQFPPIRAYDDDGEEDDDAFIGVIAQQYLRKFASTSGTDKPLDYGIRMVIFENKETKIKESNIIVGDKEYIGTPGLW